MTKYYKQLALAALMMTSLGLVSCDSKSQDEPPKTEPTIAFGTPGGWVNGPNGYVEPYHDPAFPNSPYFSDEKDIEAVSQKLKASGSKLYIPSADEMVRYFPREGRGYSGSYVILNRDPLAPSLEANVVETVQFGRNSSPIQAKSTFFFQPGKDDGRTSPIGPVNYAIRFQDNPKHRVFQRWMVKYHEQQREMFGKPQYITEGIISFLPYDESATLGGENAPVFTEEYWNSRASEIKSVNLLNWGFDKPNSVYTFGSYGWFMTSSNALGVMSSGIGFYLRDNANGPGGVIHLFEEGK